MPQPGRKLRFPIRFTVVSIFVLATLLTAALAVSLQYYFSRNMAIQAALVRFNSLADSTSQYLNAVDNKAVETTRILASYPELTNDQWVKPGVHELFATMMRNSPMLYAIYIGFDNGDFYELVNLNSSEAVRYQLKAEATDRWVVIAIRNEDQQRKRVLEYYSANFQLRHIHKEDSNYHATRRPWFIQAQAGEVNKTAPYLFHNLQAPGQTYSTRIQGGVVAVDIALSSMSDYLSTRKQEEYGNIFVYRNSGELIASNLTERQQQIIPAARELNLSEEERRTIANKKVIKISNENDWAPIDFSESGHPRGYSIDYLDLVAQMSGLRFEYVNGYRWTELVDLYRKGDIDILQPIFKNGSKDYPGEFSEPFLELPYSLVTRPSNETIQHIRELRGKTIAVPAGWSIIPVLQQQFPEIKLNIVSSTREVFEAVRNGSADAGLEVGEILHYTADKFFYRDLNYHDNIDFSPASFPTRLHFLVGNKHLDLLPVINRAIEAISSEQKAALASKWFFGPSQHQGMLSVPYFQLLEFSRQPEQHGKLIKSKIDKRNHYLFVTPFGGVRSTSDFFAVVVPERQVLQPALDKVQFSILLTVVFLLLLLPAPWIFASPIVAPIKKLAAENEKIRQRRYAQLAIPDSWIKEIDELGISMTAMVASIRQHEIRQVTLMDSFIQLIAQAIDDKSHYTAGHCERVPELAFMLASKAEEAQIPAFRDFKFQSSDEWREFKVAAWLHDCGKITTPEHIVDKGSKLETIYNRIHEIRTRFEVLWRDAEIHYWQQVADNPADEETYKQGLKTKQRQLQEDFAFVASMNVGGEFLSEDKKQRLQSIARTTWLRHFSNRAGLSPLDETRLTGEEPALPCEEQLLADRPEHIIRREHDTNYDPRLGIKMEVPKDLYNQGELYNLCIERGTLTKEDRFKINEHIIATIRMLDALPFPEELARVPRYASTHHETMKGTGYPRRLNATDLSIPERIMVLADIYEALTAADRPYKKAKPVSVAVDILAKMVADEHVDVDVFELFLSSGVYLDYAHRFLPPEQIDEVDITRYLREKTAPAV